jgi:hypothetical protein
MTVITTQDIINAIRADKVIGKGTCSFIDECWMDEDLTAIIISKKFTETAPAIKYFKYLEHAYRAKEADCNW